MPSVPPSVVGAHIRAVSSAGVIGAKVGAGLVPARAAGVPRIFNPYGIGASGAGGHKARPYDLCVIKTLYIIRHGQTDLNLRRIVQGSGVDAPLNATGHAQAAAFFRAFGHVPFDRVYTSALQRAIESVRGFLDRGIPHIATAALNEISWGRFEGLEATSEQHGQYLSAVDRWAAGDVDARLEGGESPAELAAVQRPFLEELLGPATPPGTYLIAMHGRAMRILLCQLLRYPLREMDAFPHDNLALYELVHTGSICQVRRFNNLNYATPAD